MGSYLTEFVGTFFLVLIIGLASLSGSALAPVAVGAGLMALVYMGGPISGAHYNPAITISLTLRGRCRPRDVVPYWLAQFGGALLASATVYGVRLETFSPQLGAGVSAWSGLAAEFLFTFSLALVVLSVGTVERTKGNAYYGLAIGAIVMSGAIAVGPVSGAAFNPAVGLGPTVVRSALGEGTGSELWIYFVGPIAGALGANLFFYLQGLGDEPHE